MPSSGSYSFSVNTSLIVLDAMQNIRKLGEGEVPTPQQNNDCVRKLNMIAKQWMGRQDFAPGLKMWTRVRGELFLSSQTYLYNLGPTGDNWAASTAGVAYPGVTNAAVLQQGSSFGVNSIFVDSTVGINVGDYIGIQSTNVITATGPSDLFWTTVTGVNAVTLQVTVASGNFAAQSGGYAFNYTVKAQRPLGIVTCVLRDVFGDDTPINLLTEEDYEFLPSKTQPTFNGDPTAIFYSSQLGNGQLYIDVGGAQDVTKLLHIVYLRPVQDFVNPLDTPDYPVQWALPLCWELSKQIAPSYGVPWTQEMEQNRLTSLRIAQEPDSETTTMSFQSKDG